jgi:hypothetical protein
MAITFNQMKNYSRAYNKHKQETKFKKRVKNWFASSGQECNGDKEYYFNLTLQGKHFTFLRTTSRPCNCYLCTYLKYKRIPKNKVISNALKD